MVEHIKPEMSLKELLILIRAKKSDTYYYLINKYQRCFTGDIKKDVANANKIIASIKVNNTAHSVGAVLICGFNYFYGKKFNPKYINQRPHEVSKFTTRLTKEEIQIVRSKFNEWIQNDINERGEDAYSLWPKRRLKHVFEALLCSGMRVGELISIDFSKKPAVRIVESNISHNKFAEIIINTEKTCKQREIYIPLETYNFFVENSKDPKKKLYKTIITQGFIDFREWAKFNFKLTCHALRRTKATIMHEIGVDVGTIAMVLGNTVGVVQKHYIISSGRNFDACDIGNCAVDGIVVRTSNPYMNRNYMKKNETKTRIDDYEKLLKL